MPQWVVNFADTQTADQEGRLDAPSFHRNHEPIWSVLGPFLADQSGDVLEIGSGTGQHVVELRLASPTFAYPSRWAQPSPWRSVSALPRNYFDRRPRKNVSRFVVPTIWRHEASDVTRPFVKPSSIFAVALGEVSGHSKSGEMSARLHRGGPLGRARAFP